MRRLGRLIVLDGNDGSGKQTQSEMLRSALLKLNRKVLPISFPRYQDTFFGMELRKALDGKYGDFGNLNPRLASHLYAADRWASGSLIRDAIKSGKLVIADRYMSANQIHQGGKIQDQTERENFLAWLDQLEYGEFKIPRPDASIYLDVPPVVSKQLMSDKTRDIVEENPQYLENSHASAQWLIKKFPDQWIHIRCTKRGLMRTREEIHEEILNRLRARSVL